ncbi:MAG: peptidylprolyl isomerase [Acidobacteriaceae bacterium]
MTLRFSQSSAAHGWLPGFRLSHPRSLASGLAVVVLSVATLAFPFAASAQTQPQADAPTEQSPFMPPPPPAITPGGTVVEDVIARVNDQIISRSDIERAQQELLQEGRQQGASQAEMDLRQKQLLRDLIDQQLLLSKGKQLGITGDTELVKRLDDIRKQNKFDTMEDLEKAAAAQGVSFEDFKANIRNSIITQQVVRDEVGRRLQLSMADVQKYYDTHKQEFSQPESVHLSEILIPTPAVAGGSPDNATVAKALATANSVHSSLKDGANFADLAKKFSGGATAQQGGDLGDYKRGALAKELEDKTFVLPAGGYTEPIRTRQGYVILKVDAHNAGGVPPLADVQQQVEEAIYNQQMQPALRAYLTHLREDAYIDIAPGFVDSGASPNETKPVYSAYVPPVKKVKKVVEKKRFDRRGHAVPATANASAQAASATPAVLNGTAVPGASNGAQAASASTTAPATGRMSKRKSSKSNKPQKIKREKVRFGQAPREALPTSEASTDAASAATPGTAMSAQNLGTAMMASTQAEAAPVSPLADPNADPLAPKPAEVKKGRYSDRMKLPKKKKVIGPTADPFAPPTATTQEEQTAKVQSAPLGLNGNTAAKPKKKKRQKGEKKQRLQGKQKVAPTVLQPSTAPSPLAAPPASGIHLQGTPTDAAQPAPAGQPATAPGTTPQN